MFIVNLCIKEIAAKGKNRIAKTVKLITTKLNMSVHVLSETLFCQPRL